MSEWLRALRTDNPLVFRLLILALLLACADLVHAAWLVWRTVRAARREDAAKARLLIPELRDASGSPAPPTAPPRRDGSPRPSSWPSSRWRWASTERVSSSTTRARHRPSAPRDARLAPADRERLRGMVRTLYLHAFGGRPAALDDPVTGAPPARSPGMRPRAELGLAAGLLAVLAVAPPCWGAAGRRTRIPIPSLQLPGRPERGQRVGGGAGPPRGAGGAVPPAGALARDDGP